MVLELIKCQSNKRLKPLNAEVRPTCISLFAAKNVPEMLLGDIQKTSSVLTFNMCFACVCVRPCCVCVIWYLLKRMFPFYVELAQKKKAKTWYNVVHMQKKSWLPGQSEERKQGGEYMKNLLFPPFSLLPFLVQDVDTTDCCHIPKIKKMKNQLSVF